MPAGIGVYGTTGRLEKCYRAFGFELDGEYNVAEAGMAWGKVKEQDFVGKEPHVRCREEDPRSSGLYSERLVQLLRDRDRGPIVCVLNRKGRARMLVCGSCGEIARCERCDAAVMQLDESALHCPRCDTERPVVCTSCGSSMFRNVRAGVTRAAEEVAALAGEPVGDNERIVVGTEAVLHQAHGQVGAVAFLDFDQELLAPRYRASEEALGLLALGARLLGARAAGGRLLVQTRHPRHPVLDAVLRAAPERAAAADRSQRADLRFPPYAALAAVSGPAAPAFIDALGTPLAVEVLGPAHGRWLLRAPDHGTLCDALAVTPRPAGRVRIEVDPPRV